MSALVFENVQKEYKNLTALSSVSFTVKEGEFLRSLDKTVLEKQRSSVAFREPHGAQAERFWYARRSRKNPNFTKAHLGVVPQEITFDPFFSPLEALRMRRGFLVSKK